MALVVSLVKSGLLEIQEYMRLQGQTLRGIFSRPFYFRDVVEQFEEIGVGSLTVVLLTGFFTGAVLALQSGITLDQFGARPFVGRLISASMIKELGPVLTGIDACRPRRVRDCGGARLDGRDGPDQRPSCPGDGSCP